MKNTFRKALSFALALVLISAGCLALFPTTVRADSAETSWWKTQNDLIYYYTDFYPSVSKKTMEAQYGSNHFIRYDYRSGGKEEFEELVNSGYFTNFLSDAVVIIDIKTFVPDSDTLYQLFANLRPSGETRCKAILLTRCDKNDIPYREDFERLLSACHYNVEMTGLIDFLTVSFAELNSDGDMTYLIDGKWLQPGVTGKTLLEFCNEYLFIDYFTKTLIGIRYEETLTEQRLNAFFNSRSNKNVRILVHDSISQGFYDVRSGDTIGYQLKYSGEAEDTSGWADLLFAGREDNVTNRVCLFGTWGLESNCYEAAIYLQNTYLDPDVPAYLFPIESIRYGENGLDAFTPQDFDLPDDDTAVADDLLNEIDAPLEGD